MSPSVWIFPFTEPCDTTFDHLSLTDFRSFEKYCLYGFVFIRIVCILDWISEIHSPFRIVLKSVDCEACEWLDLFEFGAVSNPMVLALTRSSSSMSPSSGAASGHKGAAMADCGDPGTCDAPLPAKHASTIAMNLAATAVDILLNGPSQGNGPLYRLDVIPEILNGGRRDTDAGYLSCFPPPSPFSPIDARGARRGTVGAVGVTSSSRVDLTRVAVGKEILIFKNEQKIG